MKELVPRGSTGGEREGGGGGGGGSGRPSAASASGHGSSLVHPHLQVRHIGAAASLEELLAVVERFHDRFSAQTACHALIKLTSKQMKHDREAFSERLSISLSLLAECLEEDCKYLRTRDVSNAAYALARLGCSRRRAFAALDAQAKQLSPGAFKAVDLSQLLWAVGKVGYRSPALLEALEPRVVELLPQLLPFQLCNILWAYAKLQQPAPQLFREAVAHVIHAMPRLHQGDLRVVVWAYGTVGQAPPALISAADRRAAQVLPQCYPIQMARLVESFSVSGHAAPSLFSATCARVSRIDLYPDELLPLVRACRPTASRPPHASALLHALKPHIIRCLPLLQPHEVAVAVRGFSGTASCSYRLLAAAEASVLQALPHITKEEAVNTAWAWAAACRQLGVASGRVVKAAGEIVLPHMHTMDFEGMSRLAWAHAAVAAPAPGLLEAIKHQTLKRGIGTAPPECLKDMLWAFAQLRNDGASVLSELVLAWVLASTGSSAGSKAPCCDLLAAACWAAATSGHRLDDETVQGVQSQLQQQRKGAISKTSLALLLEAECLSGCHILPQQVRAKAQKVWTDSYSSATRNGQAALHEVSREVLSSARALGLAARQGVPWKDGVCKTDVVMVKAKDGLQSPRDRTPPLLLQLEDSTQATPGSVLKEIESLAGPLARSAVLATIGWRPVVVFARQWKSLSGAAEREEYLSTLLHGQLPSGRS